MLESQDHQRFRLSHEFELHGHISHTFGEPKGRHGSCQNKFMTLWM